MKRIILVGLVLGVVAAGGALVYMGGYVKIPEIPWLGIPGKPAGETRPPAKVAAPARPPQRQDVSGDVKMEKSELQAQQPSQTPVPSGGKAAGPKIPGAQAASAVTGGGQVPQSIVVSTGHPPIKTAEQEPRPLAGATRPQSQPDDGDEYLRSVIQLKKQRYLAKIRSEIEKLEKGAEKCGQQTAGKPGGNTSSPPMPPAIPGHALPAGASPSYGAYSGGVGGGAAPAVSVINQGAKRAILLVGDKAVHVAEGDSVEGYTVREIRNDAVVLARFGMDVIAWPAQPQGAAAAHGFPPAKVK